MYNKDLARIVFSAGDYIHKATRVTLELNCPLSFVTKLKR